MNHGSQTIQQQGRLIEVGKEKGSVTGEHCKGEGWKMAKWPCKNCGNIWRNKQGACPTCAKSSLANYIASLTPEKIKARKIRQSNYRKSNADRIKELRRKYAEIRKSQTRTPKTRRVSNWFPCSCCLAKIGYGSKITAKLLGVTPSTVNARWAEARIKRYVPTGRNWELHRRQKRNKSNIIRIPLPISIAERKRRRFKGIIATIKRGGSRSVSSLTGCTANQLKKHLESSFRRGMTWDNHGTHWHIDHILPIASFDHSIPKQVAQCWHWTNLRPLEAKVNIIKGDRITEPQMQLLLCTTH